MADKSRSQCVMLQPISEYDIESTNIFEVKPQPDSVIRRGSGWDVSRYFTCILGAIQRQHVGLVAEQHVTAGVSDAGIISLRALCKNPHQPG